MYQTTIISMESLIPRMAEAENPHAVVPIRRNTHKEARVVKSKLGLTWTKFIQKAAEELDPGDDW